MGYSNFTNGVSHHPHKPRTSGPPVSRWRAADAAKRPSREVEKIGFAPASFLFSGTSIFGFGFKLALIGFRVRTRGFCLLLRPGIPPRLGINLGRGYINCENGIARLLGALEDLMLAIR